MAAPVSSTIKCFIFADKVCDYIPVISTVSNLADLCFKAYFDLTGYFTSGDSVETRNAIRENHYFRHIDDKHDLRCVILVLPILGNFIVIAYDIAVAANKYWTRYDNEGYMRNLIFNDYQNFQYASVRLKDDELFVADCIMIDCRIFQYVSPRLRQHRDLLEFYRNQRNHVIQQSESFTLPRRLQRFREGLDRFDALLEESRARS